MDKKIVSRAKLRRIVADLKRRNKTIVTTNGAFDMFHYGHLKSLKLAKERGDVLIVCLNSDSSIKNYKSIKRPIIPEVERAEIMAAIQYVDYVILFDERTPTSLLEMIRPDVHVKGSEYGKVMPERETIEKNGGVVFLMRRDKSDVSTSKIIDKILWTYR